MCVRLVRNMSERKNSEQTVPLRTGTSTILSEVHQLVEALRHCVLDRDRKLFPLQTPRLQQ